MNRQEVIKFTLNYLMTGYVAPFQFGACNLELGKIGKKD